MKPRLKEKFSFASELRNGSLLNTQTSLFFLAKYENEKVNVSVEPVRNKRTESQNNYLWGIVYKTIAEHTGTDENTLHEIFKRMFIPPRFVKFCGKEIKLPRSTTSLTKGEFVSYIDRVIAEAGEMSISIPLADPSKSTIKLDSH